MELCMWPGTKANGQQAKPIPFIRLKLGYSKAKYIYIYIDYIYIY